MNVVNQMVSDYQARNTAKTSRSSDKKKPKSSLTKVIPWNVSAVVVLLSGISAMGVLGYLYQHEVKQVVLDSYAMFDNKGQSAASVELLPETDKLPHVSDNIQMSEQEVKPEQEIASATQVEEKPLQTIDAAKEVVETTQTANILKKTDKVAQKKVVVANAVKPIKKVEKPAKPIIKAKKPSKKKVVPTQVAKNTKTVKSKPVVKFVAKEAASVAQSPTSEAFKKKVVPLSDEQLAENDYQRASRYVEKGQYSKAKNLLQNALDIYPEHKAASKMLIGILINDQQWLAAESHLKSAMKYHATETNFPQWLARVYLQNKRYKDAVNVLQSRERFAQGDGVYYAMLAIAQQNVKAYKKSAEAYKAALMTDGYNSKWWFGLATSLELMEDWPSAHAAYTRAINTAQLSSKMDEYARERLDYVGAQLKLAAQL